MNWLAKYLRKRYLCWKHHLCPTHNALMVCDGYAGMWRCVTCCDENSGKNIHREKVDHIARINAQTQINREWT